ncbi:unnamed protein product [Vitrella brassicaformis CCMP3155]|uniref:Uncharacterized protein n=1 Tax=Vitrella brassicaformis (strain CCMP3155) TaxID=1169540 RepID=A0A0G4FVT3_VITBC|nr:unnamed protein product [Vitrella brassicaformis CCMP3155]|eukprot:CEM19284.1 unnamed protein product [Vitrella brassicaformis CCMP3155]
MTGEGARGRGAKAELAKNVNTLFAWAFKAVVMENVLCHKEWAEEVYGELMAALLTPTWPWRAEGLGGGCWCV